MDPETGKLIVIGTTLVGAIAWLWGLAVVARAARERRASASEADWGFDAAADAYPPGSVTGAVEVAGRPEDLADKLAASLTRDGVIGPVKILGADARAVRFEPAMPGQAGFRRGQVRLEAIGPNARLEYAIELTSWPKILIALGWGSLGLALAALIAGPVLMIAFVLPSPEPAVRWQSAQIFQIVHFLWPPFLFAALARSLPRTIRGRVETLLHNLPYA